MSRDNTNTNHDDNHGGGRSRAGQDGDTTRGFRISNTNTATGNATVGWQTDIAAGDAAFTSHDSDTSGDRAARRAARDERRAARDERRARRDQADSGDSGTRASNTASGDDDVAVQIGIQLGDLFGRRR